MAEIFLHSMYSINPIVDCNYLNLTIVKIANIWLVEIGHSWIRRHEELLHGFYKFVKLNPMNL